MLEDSTSIVCSLVHWVRAEGRLGLVSRHGCCTGAHLASLEDVCPTKCLNVVFEAEMLFCFVLFVFYRNI